METVYKTTFDEFMSDPKRAASFRRSYKWLAVSEFFWGIRNGIERFFVNLWHKMGLGPIYFDANDRIKMIYLGYTDEEIDEWVGSQNSKTRKSHKGALRDKVEKGMLAQTVTPR